MTSRSRVTRHLILVVSLAVAAIIVPRAFALILGGEGNMPINDPGWPKGAAVIFNTPSRIAYWEGPPFGGGQWHAECRGDAKALNKVLADFTKLNVKSKRIVLHDGVGQSFWLNMNQKPAKRAAAKMDWSFMVWQPGNWERLRNFPADLNPTNPADAKNGPPAQIDIYTGGNIKWADVKVPQGLKIIDQRLEAHGFKLADGIVVEGKVTDLTTMKPLAAKVRIESVDPQKKGGYEYTKVAQAATDREGHWVLSHVPAGWHRIVVEAQGYVPRIAGYVRHDDQPRWENHDCGLARAAIVSGQVKDDEGKPLPGVEVRLSNVTTESGERYESPDGYKFMTDANGRFLANQIPVGKATIWLHRPGYVRPGLGQNITTPKKDVALSMMKSAKIIVTVDFTGKQRPNGYMVRMKPEGGEKIGTYGGSGNIDAKNQMTFDNVPPGKYILHGRPNPGSDDQETEPINIDAKGGQTIEVRLVPK